MWKRIRLGGCLSLLRNYSQRFVSSAGVTFENHSKEVNITWKSGEVSSLPYEFLRDNCQCPLCFHETSRQSLVLLPDVLTEAESGLRSACFEDDYLLIVWNSGHKSAFPASWLKSRAYSSKRSQEKSKHAIPGLKNILWGAEKKDTMKFFDFELIMNEDSDLLQWMEILATEGLCVLKNAPKKPGQLKVLASRGFGDLYKTMYGESFQVKEKPSASNLAYTSGYLALHTDQPYYKYQPGIQFLHCISGSIENQAVNQLVDGFKVAHDLREENPGAFKILTTLAFPYEQHGNDVFGDFILAADTTSIGLDEHGEINRISHNYPSRAAYMNHPSKETRQLYKAAGVLLKMMYDPKYLVEYQLKEGDILGFHNKRVLHGRTAYDARLSNRWLEGGYGSWDDFYSRMRSLIAKSKKL